jgi:PPM family protein phosphatase
MGRFLRVAGVTDVGQERDHNEDSFGLMPQFDLLVVADGMGGHRAGDVASQMAIEAIEEFFVSTEREDITWPFHFDPNLPFAVNRLITAVQVANSRIYQASMKNSEHQGMGTTVVGMHFVDDRSVIHIAHVGDSRGYRIRNGEIELLTMDHSLVNDYLRAAPDLSPEQLAELPTNVITRALGMQDNVVVDVQSNNPEIGDVLLLCSDGLNGMISDEEILQHVNDHPEDMEAAGQALVTAANENGGEDNVTVVLAQVAEE